MLRITLKYDADDTCDNLTHALTHVSASAYLLRFLIADCVP